MSGEISSVGASELNPVFPYRVTDFDCAAFWHSRSSARVGDVVPVIDVDSKAQPRPVRGGTKTVIGRQRAQLYTKYYTIYLPYNHLSPGGRIHIHIIIQLNHIYTVIYNI